MSVEVDATPPPPQSTDFAFFPPELWVSFCEASLVHARMAGLDVRYGATGQLESRDGASYGLLTIARKCAELDRDDWDDALATYFEQIASVVDNDEFGTEVLRVRLFPAGVVPAAATEQPQWREFAPGVLAALVAALPGALRTLNPTDIDRLGLGEDEAWDIAWTNVLDEEVDKTETETSGSATLRSFFGRSFFIASKVGRLEQLVGPLGPNGALVAIPRRHSLAVHVIEDLSVVDAIKALLPYAMTVAAQGPGPISNQVFWCRNGELVALPAEEKDQQITFSPPIEFIEMMNTLAPAPAAPDTAASPETTD